MACSIAPSYVSGPSDVPLIGMTIGMQFEAAVEQWPDRDALVVPHQEVQFSYAQLKREVDLCARALMRLGVGAGDRVGIWAPNCAEWTITQFATAKIGAM